MKKRPMYETMYFIHLVYYQVLYVLVEPSYMRTFPTTEYKEFDVFKKQNSPIKIQDFLDTLPANFEKDGSTCRSPLAVLRHNKAHCIEGALLAAAMLWYQGEKPPDVRAWTCGKFWF